MFPIPDSVRWYDGGGARIALTPFEEEEEEGEEKTSFVSTLMLSSARPEQSGRYRCQPMNRKGVKGRMPHADVSLHIVNGKSIFFKKIAIVFFVGKVRKNVHHGQSDV